MPDSACRPAAQFAAGLLARFGVEVETYPATLGAGIAALIRPDTALLWCESPGSITMEVQDVPALVEAARRHGVAVAPDDTYAAGILFDAFAHGVDVSMQALTTDVGGHGDLLLGTVSDLGRDVVTRLVDGLRLFEIGFSWGGVTSLVMAYDSVPRHGGDVGPRSVRLNVGLEDEGDLIGDLSAALDKAQG